MQHDITKLCADSLRIYLRKNYDINLKSGHAHEIVAAFLGYNSRISMLDDDKYPISNLDQAEFILLNPHTSFIEQRLKSLKELPSDLPSIYILAESVYSCITNNPKFLNKVQPSFNDLAISLAEQNLHKRLNMFRINPKSIEWKMDVKVERNEGSALLTVDVGYHTNAGEFLNDSQHVIYLPRVAANLGYGRSKISETRYSGNARKPHVLQEMQAHFSTLKAV